MIILVATSNPQLNNEIAARVGKIHDDEALAGTNILHDKIHVINSGAFNAVVSLKTFFEKARQPQQTCLITDPFNITKCTNTKLADGLNKILSENGQPRPKHILVGDVNMTGAGFEFLSIPPSSVKITAQTPTEIAKKVEEHRYERAILEAIAQIDKPEEFDRTFAIERAVILITAHYNQCSGVTRERVINPRFAVTQNSKGELDVEIR